METTSIIDRKKELARLYLKSRGLEVKQENGQRIIHTQTHMDEDMEFPRGTEVFIGRIPRDIFEDELLPLFDKAGTIYKFRLMMDFSGYNRGFGFAQYTTRAGALNAINLLDQYEIREGYFIGVVESLDNCKLYIDNLPLGHTADEIKLHLSSVTSGVKQVTIPLEGQQFDKIHAIVEYETHRYATMARRYLVPSEFTLFGRQIKVDWAKPDSVTENKLLKCSTLYIGNLSRLLSDEFLELIFSLRGVYTIIKLDRVTATSVFVSYKARVHATDMYETINNYRATFSPLTDSPDLNLTVSWAGTNEIYRQKLGLSSCSSRLFIDGV